ncbi:transcriptional regulator [Agrobacterium sp. TS43]|uniref:anti-sigma factor family protein n=1 Tax=Agrobacterium TaxID=357 RepID=UPI00049EA603|nr:MULTISPECIES: anti-sigma factor [Agrobacterium]KDR90601.1 transcriptional regulator [Agrobacterium tumefaciens GW4]KVK47068.1 transcriptional regulator [Agrobacterium sp. LY4]KVK47609.1 transcriptional regulator [Agrobacterium sp. JL28]KVK60385.1 transcriptional regulator [Agrobacterium sp. TS45]KVK65703.1 transcriptional regulator [Agrobacterium sp. C13]
MTGSESQITEADLISYVDGQLEDPRRDAVRAHLASNPADASKVAMWQQQNATLTALYGPLDTDALPERLDVYRIERRLRSQRADWRNMAAASILILAIGLAGGWFGRGLVSQVAEPAHSIVADATQAHKLFASEVLHPVEIRADAENASSLPKWLSKRLDRKLNIPDLTRHGLSLVGGRVLPSSEGAAAQLMYEDKSGQRVTLYIVAAVDSSDTAMRRSSIGSLEAISWDDETIRCALVGNLPSDRMDAIAKDTYQQLS